MGCTLAGIKLTRRYVCSILHCIIKKSYRILNKVLPGAASEALRELEAEENPRGKSGSRGSSFGSDKPPFSLDQKSKLSLSKQK